MAINRTKLLGLLFVTIAIFLGSYAYGEGKYRVLFDAGHAQSAGRHADWVIDDDLPTPRPARPSSSENWSGGLSSWAFDLYKSGRYEVESTQKPLSFGVLEDPQDLSRFDVLILCEPNADLKPLEREAIISFVKAGGGVFLIANHVGSDRDGDGIDSTGVFNKLESQTGIHFQGKGEFHSWLKGGHYTASFCMEGCPMLQGPFGMVERIYLNSFGTIRLLKALNPSATGHIWLEGSRPLDMDILLATASLGRGRVAALSDSSPADDGTTTAPGKQLYNGWLANGVQNNWLILNTTEFLAVNGLKSGR